MSDVKQAIAMMLSECPGAYSIQQVGRVVVVQGHTFIPEPEPTKRSEHLKVATG